MNSHCANSFNIILHAKYQFKSPEIILSGMGGRVYSPGCLCILSSNESSLFLHSYDLPATEPGAWLQRKILFKVNNAASGCTMSAEISDIIKEFIFIVFAEDVCILPILHSTPLN